MTKSAVTLHRDGSISFFSCWLQHRNERSVRITIDDLRAESERDQRRLRAHFERHGWRCENIDLQWTWTR